MAGHLVLLAIKYLTINSNLLALRLPRSLHVFFFPSALVRVVPLEHCWE